MPDNTSFNLQFDPNQFGLSLLNNQFTPTTSFFDTPNWWDLLTATPNDFFPTPMAGQPVQFPGPTPDISGQLNLAPGSNFLPLPREEALQPTGGLFGLSPLQTGAAIGIPTAALGLMLAQSFAGGTPEERIEIQKAITASSPEEQAAFQQALQGLQQAQQFAFGVPGQFEGLQQELTNRAPAERQAFEESLAQLRGQVPQAQQSQNVMDPEQLRQILQGQAGILGPLSTLGTRLAQGQLPEVPGLRERINQIFSNRVQELLQSGVQRAQEQGFPGGMELLAHAPGNALIAPALGQIQGQAAAAELDTLLRLPELAANAAGAFSTPAALRLAAIPSLASLNINLAQALGGVGQQGVINRSDFLRAITAPLAAATGLGQAQLQGRLGAGGQITTGTRSAPTFLESFAPTAALLSGAGGLLGGIGMLSGNPLSARLSGTGFRMV